MSGRFPAQRRMEAHGRLRLRLRMPPEAPPKGKKKARKPRGHRLTVRHLEGSLEVGRVTFKLVPRANKKSKKKKGGKKNVRSSR